MWRTYTPATPLKLLKSSYYNITILLLGEAFVEKNLCSLVLDMFE